MRASSLSLALVVLAGCSAADPSSPVGAIERAAGELVDHGCTLSTLPSDCGVPAAELPCCAVDTAAGEEQMNCCPSRHGFVHRLCAAGRPVCPSGGTYLTASCADVVCPAQSWPCEDRPGCCNDCGQIGPRGRSVCDLVPYEHQCDTVSSPRNDVCVGVFDYQGRLTRVTLPDGTNNP